jgi:hypothetical protein
MAGTDRTIPAIARKSPLGTAIPAGLVKQVST